MSRYRCYLRSGVVALAVATLMFGFGSAHAGDRDNHCVHPSGIDLNEYYGTNDAFVSPFCTEVHAGDRWRPILRWVGASSHDVIPAGYIPSRPTPVEDFLAKFESARYVVDAGTRQERTYVFSVSELLVDTAELPDGTRSVAWTPRLHPVRPGDHTVDIYVTLSADHWDGLGLDPQFNRIPGGESFAISNPFAVITGS